MRQVPVKALLLKDNRDVDPDPPDLGQHPISPGFFKMAILTTSSGYPAKSHTCSELLNKFNWSYINSYAVRQAKYED